MTAQHAQRQGKQVARNVAASLGNGKARSYKHHDLGFVVDLGGLAAAANPLNIPLSGPLANAVTRAYHLIAIAGNRARVLAGWGELEGRRTAHRAARSAHPPVTGTARPADRLPVVIAFSVLTYLASAISLLGSVTVRLPFWPTVLTQGASSFINRVSPANVGGMALNVRFL